MFAHEPSIPQRYLLDALTGGTAAAISYLTSINSITAEHSTASFTLLPTPYGSYIISHLPKTSSTQLTNFVISLANHHTYAMIATMDTPIEIKLPTTITISGSHHQQIAHIQLNPHNRGILGRAYLSLYQNPFTQHMNPSIPIPKVHPTKGLT
jgi:hypothetical protein